LIALGLVGCAAGGGGVDTGVEETTTETIRDEKGFERELGPAEIAYQSARQFYDVGNYEETVVNLEKAVSVKPNYLDAWTLLGDARTKLKDYEGGIEAFNKALELDPNNEVMISFVAFNYLQLEKLDEAEKYYGRLLALNPLSAEANGKLGFIYQKRGDAESAIRYYEKALESNPYDAVMIGSVANLYGTIGNNEKKIEYLIKAIEANPEQVQFQRKLRDAGNEYIKAEDFANALIVYQALVDHYPDEAAYHKYLGLTLSKTGRNAEAAAELQKANDLKPDDPYSYAYLALILNELKKPNDAIATAKQGLAVKGGEEAFLYYQYGVALSQLGRFDESIEMFERSINYKDPLWIDKARKQISNQEIKKKRAKALKEKQEWE
jgi:superkiller protein 3